MNYDVLREHLGERLYRKGDLREAQKSSVTHLVRAGVLAPAKGKKAAEKPDNKAAQQPKNKTAPGHQDKSAP